MSKKTFGWRKAAFAGLASTLVFGGALAGASVASAAVPPQVGQLDGPPAGSLPIVFKGETNAAAGGLDFEFLNNFTTNSAVTFTIGTANCSTATGVSQAIEFASAPTVTLTGPTTGIDQTAPGTAGDTTPTYTTALGSSSAACATVGIQDTFTIKLTAPSSGTATNAYTFELTGVEYNVGSAANGGNVTVFAASADNPATGSVETDLGGDFAVNAEVSDGQYTVDPVVGARPSAENVELGTVKFKEDAFGNFFDTGVTTVTLELDNNAEFKPGVTPTITAPPNYVISNPVATDGSDAYTFTVTNNVVAGSPATVTIDGFIVETPSDGVVDLDATLTGPSPGTYSAAAINVTNIGLRIGGQDRFKTSAEVFRAFIATNPNPGDVVLSGGLNFPDALSANYLAGQYNTGVLLTTPDSLPRATEDAILDYGIERVFITGGFGVVSQGVEDHIASLHVGDNQFQAHIQVVRLAGPNRYATNQAVNNYNFENAETVIVASGNGFADALAMGPIAYAKGYPILLTNGTSVDDSLGDQLAAFNPTNVVIAGGPASVSTAEEAQIRAMGYTVSRIGGQNRGETSTKIALWATEGLNDDQGADLSGILGEDQHLDNSRALLTNGGYFADALSGGPLAGSNDGVVLLARDRDTLGDPLVDYLNSKEFGGSNDGEHLNGIVALGLTGVTTPQLLFSAAAAIGQ